MFANNEEPKLDWMYKGPNALVDRESYLLGRTVDKALEQLNDEEKSKATNQLLAPPKNHVEHECIPPSIRDYNKIVKSEQVDLQAKLQEDPLVLIKRQEEETRRQFLQNPIQLKKLQEALKAQQEKKKERKKDSKVDKKLRKKIKSINKHLKDKIKLKKLGVLIKNSNEDEEILDTILMHKFNFLKSMLSEDDFRDILKGRFTDSDSSSESQDDEYKSSNSKGVHSSKHSKRNSESSSSYKKDDHKNSRSNHSDSNNMNEKKREFDVRNHYRKGYEHKKKNERNKMSEEEKEALRQSMMQSAVERSKESAKKYRKHEENDDKPSEYNDEFIRKELLRATNASSVSDRIKSNIYNIQRSKSSMETNFLK